jgi:peptidyl-tRNA hydrolase
MTDDTLRMYAIIRNDLEMTAGKMASQAGHAFVDTYELCLTTDPERLTAYTGTKVVVGAKDETHIRRAYEQAQAAGLPCVLIVDAHHVMPPHFDGNPIVTALGIGPVRRDEVHAITKRFQVVK